MHILDIETARKLIQKINDKKNPYVSMEALRLRDKWIIENDLGVLNMSSEVRQLLDLAETKNDS
jgi:hypothetical protein